MLFNLQCLVVQTVVVITTPFRRLYVPATQFGGGERLIWEARVAGVRSICSRLELRATHCVLQIPSERIEIESDNDGLREFISGTLSDIPPALPSLPRHFLSFINFCANGRMQLLFTPSSLQSTSEHFLISAHVSYFVVTNTLLGPILGPEYYARQLARALVRAAALQVQHVSAHLCIRLLPQLLVHRILTSVVGVALVLMPHVP